SGGSVHGRGLDARARHAAKADLVVGDPKRDQRYADGGRPEPTHRDREEREIDDREGRYRRDVRAEHARHVTEPPRVPVRRRTYELPDVEPGQDHPENTEDHRNDAEPLPRRAGPDQPEDHQRRAHGERHERGGPVDRHGSLPPVGALAPEYPIARERQVEAEDGQERQKDLRPPQRENDGGRRDHRHRPEVGLAPAPVRSAALHGEHGYRRQAQG